MGEVFLADLAFLTKGFIAQAVDEGFATAEQLFELDEVLERSQTRAHSEFPKAYGFATLIHRVGVDAEIAADIAEKAIWSNNRDIWRYTAHAVSLYWAGARDTMLNAFWAEGGPSSDRLTSYSPIELAYIPPEQAGDDQEHLPRYQRQARLILEGHIDACLAKALDAANVDLSPQELRLLPSDTLVALVRDLRAQGALAPNDLVRHPSSVEPPAIELPPMLERGEISFGDDERAQTLTGLAYPNAIVRLEGVEHEWQLEAQADQEGQYAIDLTALAPGRWFGHLRQRPDRAVAFSLPSAELEIDRSGQVLDLIEWYPGDGADQVTNTRQIKAVFSEALSVESVAGAIFYLTGASSGDVPADIKQTDENTLILTPRTPLNSEETYTLFWGAMEGVTGSRPAEAVQAAGRFTTAFLEPGIVTSVSKRQLNAARGWAGEVSELILEGEGLPHGLDISIGSLKLDQLEWLSPSSIRLLVLADQIGHHPLVLSVPSGPIQTEFSIEVIPPKEETFIYGTREGDGPGNGAIEVFIPSEIRPIAPFLTVGESHIAPSRERYFKEGVFSYLFHVPEDIRRDIKEDTEIAVCYDLSFSEDRAEESEEEGIDLPDEPLSLVPLKPLFDDAPAILDAFAPVQEFEEHGENLKKKKRVPAKQPARVGQLNACFPCGFITPAEKRTKLKVCVGDKVYLPIAVCVTDDDTLLTVSHQFGGRGAANGGWSSRFDQKESHKDKTISLTARQAGTVDLEAKLWCKGKSEYRYFTVVIENCRNARGGPGGGGGGGFPPPPGGGPGGGGRRWTRWRRLAFSCRFGRHCRFLWLSTRYARHTVSTG